MFLQQQPIFSDVAKFFAYPVIKANSTNGVPQIAAAFGTDFGYVNLMAQNYFVLTGFRAVTNYDGAGGVAATADVASVFIAPPFVPNNFTVSIARGQNNLYSNQPLTQAEICSSGYLAGKQLPFPVIYGPRFNFTFTFTDLTGLFLDDADDAPVPLSIQMWMVGYNVPVGPQWERFLAYFPALANVFAS